METVRSERTHSLLPSDASPLSPPSPLLMSAETTYAPLALIRSIAVRYGSETSPLKPVPNMQSSTEPNPSGFSSSMPRLISIPAFSQSSK